MIRAYDEAYLRNARGLLAGSLDYAVNTLGYELGDYYGIFVNSDVAAQLEAGNPFIILGRSGIELALLVLEKHTGEYLFQEKKETGGRSPEYWAGWALAFYQWYSACSFRELNGQVPIDNVIKMYDKYHEMDIMQFVDRVDELRSERRIVSYLKELRKLRGYSQSELAESAGIPVKTLQHYEQGTKSLAKANASYVINLARVLQCKPERLLEG